MYELVRQHEPEIRLGAFLGIFCLVAAWEMLAPKRTLVAVKGLRWLNNLALVGLNTLVVRFIFPILGVGIAQMAADAGWGLFNRVDGPAWFEILLAAALLDLLIYLQHVAFHKVPLLWRLHRVHHADPDIDVTTGARFHTFEIILSQLIKMAAIALLGAPVLAVVLFEVLLNGTAMFNHGNIALPPRLDRYLRWFLVTPDMHRVHHSVHHDETDSNYGFNLPWWDRIFATYRAQPRDGHQGMTIGLSQYQANRRQTLPWMLVLPFKGADDA